MKVFQLKKYEINILLIGHDQVGKKSFAKRLKGMNSSETKEIKKEFKIPNDSEIKAILHQKGNLFNSKEEVILYEKKRNKEDKLCSFRKTILVEFTQIDIVSHIIRKPQIKRENEDNQFKEYLNFQRTKTHLSSILSDTTKANILKECKTIFVFCFLYDYSNYDSFEKMKIYYNELSNSFKFQTDAENYCSIGLFLGNKIDSKQVLPEDLQNNYINFFNDQSFFNLDISTASYYSFEKFFKQFFDKCLKNTLDEQVRTKEFEEKFDSILFSQKTFSKAEKHKLEDRKVPGPKYDLDLYSVINDQKFISAFEKKSKKFAEIKKERDEDDKNTKIEKEYLKSYIFMNKTGPIFFKGMDDKNREHSKKLEQKKKLEDSKKDFNDINIQHKNYSSLNKNGFSLGIRPSTINYKNDRRAKMKEKNNELNELFKTNVIFYKDKKSRSSRRPQKTSRKNTFSKNRKNDTEIKNHSEKLKEAIQRRNEINDEKIKNLEDLKKRQMEQFENYLEKVKSDNENRRQAASSRSKIKKVEVFPKLVDVSQGFINKKNKFTMGARVWPESKTSKNCPEFNKIESDIEYRSKHPNLSFPKADRFRLTGLEMRERLKDEYLKQNQYYKDEEQKLYEIQEIKLKSELYSKRNKFFENREDNKQKVNKHKVDIMNTIKNMTHDTPGPGAYSPMFEFVEESAPNYTLKGKLKNDLFEINTNYNDPTKLLDYDSNLNILPNLPDFNIVKENNPRVIFSRDSRFKENFSNNNTHFKGNVIDFESSKTGFYTVEPNNDKNIVL